MKTFVLVFALLLNAVASEWVAEMESDIQLDPDEKKQTNGYASIKGGRWPDGVVPYYLGGFSNTAVIKQAFAEYHKSTCLKFVPRTNQRSYISFYGGSGCSSPVGYRYGRNNRISLGRGCNNIGTVMHEIGHSIGLYHEQSRPDRNKYVTILLHNIQKDMQFNFNMQAERNIDSLGTPYDFESMMHYGATAFGNGRLTIRTNDPSKQRLIGRRSGFSKIDIKQINLMYCKGTNPQPKTTVGPGICVDKDRRCAYWATQNYCQDPTHVNYMKTNCCKSCSSSCSDGHQNCPYWANREECTKNPNYMRINCRKSCRIC